MTALIFLSISLCTFQIAEQVHTNFVRKEIRMTDTISKILKDKTSLTPQENENIKKMVQSHKKQFPSYQYLALYLKSDFVNDSDPFISDTDPQQSQYLYPKQAQKKNELISSAFYTSNTTEVGDKWYIVQQYHPTGGYYYEITVLIASLSGISFLLWLFIQIRCLLWIRQLKQT